MKAIWKLLIPVLFVAVFFAACDNESEPAPEPTEVLGCMDAAASNYNPEATKSDGSCTYEAEEVLGCTDAAASNYNPNANKDDGSCTYEAEEVPGCTDPEALNYNPDATVSDGSCEYASETITEMPGIFQQKVLIEYFTGTWCSACPDGQVHLDEVLEKHPERAIAAIPHTKDPMMLPEYRVYMKFELNGAFAPGATVNRSPYAGNGDVYIQREHFMDATENILNSSPTNNIGVAIETELSGDELKVVSHVGFLSDSDQKYKFFLLVLEDSVIGDHEDYHQANYYNYELGHPYYGLGDPIVGYPHRKVVRAYAHDVDGEAIPQEEVKANNVYIKTNTFDVSAYRKEQVSVVVFVVASNGAPIDSPVVNVQTVKAGRTKNWD